MIVSQTVGALVYVLCLCDVCFQAVEASRSENGHTFLGIREPYDAMYSAIMWKVGFKKTTTQKQVLAFKISVSPSKNNTYTSVLDFTFAGETTYMPLICRSLLREYIVLVLPWPYFTNKLKLFNCVIII